MANGLYTTFKEQLLDGALDLDTNIINVALLDNTYAVNIGTDFNYTADCAASEIDTGALAGKSITNGVFDATDFEFSNVTHGSPVRYVIIYQMPSEQLIAYFENDDAGAITSPATGEDVLITWNGSGIFSL